MIRTIPACFFLDSIWCLARVFFIKIVYNFGQPIIILYDRYQENKILSEQKIFQGPIQPSLPME